MEASEGLPPGVRIDSGGTWSDWYWKDLLPTEQRIAWSAQGGHGETH